MCGIAGILDFQEGRTHSQLVHAMCNALAHRGPDDSGVWTSGPITLGHRRLSILDLETGHQPLALEGGRFWITYNGEIYNFAELRAEALSRGYNLRTKSDTEAIVATYATYGVKCLCRLRGMFAFALWDDEKRQLLLARDPVGKKPLFYAVTDQQLVFASELHALMQHPGIENEVDTVSLDHYLTFGYVPAPRTIYKAARKLLPGHYIVAGGGAPAPTDEIVQHEFWRLEFEPKRRLSEQEAEEALTEELQRAVDLRMVADVPVGALLSGGVDSSLVVALMARNAGGAGVRTFSIGFEEAAYNELPHARTVAEHLGTEHHELIVRPDAVEILPKLVRHYGEPFADSSAIPTYYVAKLTREHVKVVLNGDGGDECMAGYDRYLATVVAEKYRRAPTALKKALSRAVGALVSDSLPRRHRLGQLKRFLDAANTPLEERYLGWVSYFNSDAKRALYSADFKSSVRSDCAPFLLSLFEEASGLGAVDRQLYADVRSYLPYDLLVKMDIATMANSLEARSPLLDTKVLEFSARLPERLKIRGVTLKYLTKKIASKFVPSHVINRRKMGFGVPIAEWLRSDLRPLLMDTLTAASARNRGYFDYHTVDALIKDHMSGKDRSFQLWALLWLELWHIERERLQRSDSLTLADAGLV